MVYSSLLRLKGRLLSMKKSAEIESLFIDSKGCMHVSIVLKTGTKHAQMKKTFLSMQSYNAYMLELGRKWKLEY
jgi:hypothetical protein